MRVKDILPLIRNDLLEFATMKRQDSQLPTLEREIIITSPPELVDLSRTGDKSILEDLVRLLNDPERAWAAEVVLAAMTGNEQDMVNSFATVSNEWRDSELGRTAHERWSKWLDKNKDNLEWDPIDKVFVSSRK